MQSCVPGFWEEVQCINAYTVSDPCDLIKAFPFCYPTHRMLFHKAVLYNLFKHLRGIIHYGVRFHELISRELLY